jgi:aminopeptidase N
MLPGGQLSATDRLGLISDCFAAGRAGYASISDSLHLIKDFGRHEIAEYAVWQELSDNLAALASLYKEEPFFAKFQGFLRTIYANQMEKLGWDKRQTDDEDTGTLRATIINMMGLAGDTGVLEEALRRFKTFVEDPSTSLVTADVRTAVFRTALRADESLVSADLKRIFEMSAEQGIQRSCLSVLGRVKDSSRHAEMLDYVLFSGKVRYQDMAFLLNGLAATTTEGGRRCWENFADNFDRLASKFRQQHVVWGMLLGVTTRGLKTLEEANEAEQFFADPEHPAGAGQRRVAQALEAVRTNAVRLDRDRNAVASFLDGVVVV